LRKAAYSVLNEAEGVSVVAIEGGGDLAVPWFNEIDRRKWRTSLLLSRHQRHGAEAKKHADTLARKIIEWSGAKRPTSLRHDAAEAICIGFWAVVHIGWLPEVPVELRD
jgi:hypothetical protein